MAFQDYSTTPASNTTIGEGTFIGPNMPRDNVRPALQQFAADGRALYDKVVPTGDYLGKIAGWDAAGRPVGLSGTGSDAALRTDLATAIGASLVGTGGGQSLADSLGDLVAKALRGSKTRPLSTLLRGRKFRAALGAKNGYTSAGALSAATISTVVEYPYDPFFGAAPNIVPQKAENRRKVTSITIAVDTGINYMTVVCERRHGLVAGQRIRMGGSTLSGIHSPNTADNTDAWGTPGGQGAKAPYPLVTPADVAAGEVAKGLPVFDVVDEFTFRTKFDAGIAWPTETTATLYWEPVPVFWPATDPVFDWVVPGRREALPRNQQGSAKPSFGTASTGELGASGASATTDAQVKIAVVEFTLFEDVLVLCSRSGKFRIFADGVPVHNGVLDVSSPDPGYRTTITFADARTRLIRIETTNAPGSNFVPADIYGFWTRGRNAIGPARAQEQRRPLMLLCGDSFVEGEGIPNWHLSFGSLMAERLGWNVIHGGLGSTGLTTGGVHGVNMNYGDRMKVMKAGGVEPDVICVLNSLNDFGDVTEVLATKFIDRLRVLWPNVEVIVLGSGYPTESPTVGRLASDAAWLAAANARGVPFIDGGIGTQGLPMWLTAGNKATYYHGTAATATATASAGAVTAVATATAGAGYDPANGVPVVSFSGGGGTGATATATVNYKVTDIQIVNGGRDYTTATLSIGHGAYASAVESGGEITGVMVNNPGGVLFTSPPPITFSGGGGSGAAATAVLEGGVLVAINVTSGGSGYSGAPTVSIGICSAAATATATITDGVITGVTITSAGNLYTETPVITVAGDGYGAELVPFISGTVTGVTVTNGGSGYVSAPVVTIAHPNGDDVTHPKPNGHRLLAHRYAVGIEQQVAS